MCTGMQHKRLPVTRTGGYRLRECGLRVTLLRARLRNTALRVARVWGNQSRNTVQQVVQRLGDVSLPPGPFVALILGTVTPPFDPREGTAVTLGTPPLPEPV